MPQPPQFALSKSVLVQTPLQNVPPGPHGLLMHVPWLQIGVDAAQTYPQAPQFCGSEFTEVHVPLQQIVPVLQQVKAPQLPQRRLVLPLQALHVATH